MKLSTQIVILAVAVMTTIALTFFMYSCAYPLKYKDSILEASEKYDVEPYLVASIINSESSFNKDAVSHKGAIGLMQVMPSTASMVAKQLKLSEYDLFDEQTNIKIGTYYLSTLLSYFGNLSVAICAYNAGPTRVKSWLQNEQFSTDGKTLVNIPYVETQKYLANVLKNIKFYQNRFN